MSRQDGDTEGVGHTYSHLYGSTSCFLCHSNKGSTFSLNISDDPKEGHSNLIERAEIAQLVRSRMQSLALPPEDYDDVSEKRNSLSYVIINPSCDLKLEEGDIVYLIRPSPFSAQKTFERHNSRRKSNISLCDTRRRSTTTFQRPPPLQSAAKSNSLSLPDSPQISPAVIPSFSAFPTGYVRGRSNSLRVDDILMRRSNSLRFGLEATRKINSFEELGINPLTPLSRDERTGSIKIPVNGSIGLEVGKVLGRAEDFYDIDWAKWGLGTEVNENKEYEEEEGLKEEDETVSDGEDQDINKEKEGEEEEKEEEEEEVKEEEEEEAVDEEVDEEEDARKKLTG
ncbi:slowpoke 2 [Oratosquilla oratoria]|uniref:slowpoke 2 n=1 Tax=Oratosquilla oratoria TaxID=337810 RepID=UPI003F76AFF3